MSSEASVTFECPKCGWKELSVEDTDDDDSAVTCANPDCDTGFGTWGEVKAKAMDKVWSGVVGEAKKAFKGIKRR